MSEASLNITDEVELIPGWAIALGLTLFAGLQVLMHAVLFPREPHPTPLAWRIFISTMAGLVLLFYVLLIGYVSRDARRREMNVTRWVLLVIFVPNAIGFIIYFLMRQPLRITCPQCGHAADPAFNFCPRCKLSLHPACPACHRPVRAGDLFCPFCAQPLVGESSTELSRVK
jgi:hypothetical protein